MKLIAAEILTVVLLILAVTNFVLAQKALEFSKSKVQLNELDQLANAMNSMTGQPTKKERTLTNKEQADVYRFIWMKKTAFKFLFVSIAIGVLVTVLLLAKRKILLHIPSLPVAQTTLLFSWLLIIASYYLFVYWEQQKMGDGYLFSGYGFSPTKYFSIIWIGKNLLTAFNPTIIRGKCNETNYKMARNLLIADVILGNMALFCVHESIAGIYTILNYSWPNIS